MRLPARKPTKTSTNIKFSDMVYRFYRFIVHALLPLKIARHCDTVRHCMDDFNAPAHPPPPSNFNPFNLKEPAEKIRAIFPEPVEQARAPSNFALQGSQRLLSKIASRASDVVDNALKQIGVRYRNGGNTPKKGFDCSGLVHYVFQNTL